MKIATPSSISLVAYRNTREIINEPMHKVSWLFVFIKALCSLHINYRGLRPWNYAHNVRWKTPTCCKPKSIIHCFTSTDVLPHTPCHAFADIDGFIISCGSMKHKLWFALISSTILSSNQQRCFIISLLYYPPQWNKNCAMLNRHRKGERNWAITQFRWAIENIFSLS